MTRILDWVLSRAAINHTGMATSLGLLVLRIGLGLMVVFGHGWGKLGRLGDVPVRFGDPYGLGPGISLGLAVFAEFFCGLAVALGLFTRAAVIPLMITMLTAALVIHGGDPWGRKELALMYFVPFLAILFTGPGRYSIDAFFSRRQSA